MADKNDDEVLVEVPLTDIEALEHMLLGVEPVERPVRMSRSDYNSLKYVGLVALFFSAAVLLGQCYVDVKQNYDGSVSKAYQAYKKQVEKAPWHILAGG